MNGGGFWTLRRKTFLALLLAALVPLAVTAALVLPGGRKLMQSDAGARLAVAGDAAADRIDAVNERYFELLSGLDRIPALHGACADLNAGRTPDANSREILSLFAASDTSIHAIGIADRGGRIGVATVAAYEGTDVMRRAYHHAARTRPGPTVEVLVLSRTGEPMTVLAYARALNGAPDPCVVVVAVDVERLSERVRELHGVVGAGSFVAVLDERGIYIAHSYRQDLLFRPVAPLPPAELETMVAAERFGPDTRERLEAVIGLPQQFERALQAVLDDPSHIVAYRSPSNNRWNMSIARRLRTVPWTIFVSVPSSTIYAPSHDLLRTAKLVGVAAVVVLLLLAMTISGRVTAPLRDLANAADALAAGNQSTRVAIRGCDEVAAVAQRFNEMAAAIEGSTQHLERRVAERTERLAASNEQLRAASAELLAQTTELQAQRDQLEQRNAEVARADRAKSEFLANMSHELRTPLNAVIGFADLLQVTAETRLDPVELAQLGDIVSAGKHLLLIINDILDVAKIDSGTVKLELERIEPASVLADTCAMAQPLAKAKQIELRTTIRARSAVLADAARLRQILLNLLTNAIKFSAAGSAIDIDVADDGDQVRFAVTDRGPGIAPDLVGRLFQPFVQGEGTLTKRHQGTGLGLAICKKLVDLHGGTIELDSRVGVGTTVVARLPASSRRARPSASPGSAPLVLIVGGGRWSDMTRTRLEAAGYQIRVAHAGDDLVAVTDATAFALVVIDASGGTDDGARLLDQATRLSASLPVLLCAAHPQILAAKPLEPAALRALCRHLAATTSGPARVLIVDDDPCVATLAAAALGDGYVVVPAATKAAGFARATGERFDLIIVDLGLPDGSGIDLLDDMAEHEHTRAVPRVVLTASQPDGPQLERLRRHAAAVARKGAVTPDELVAVADRLTQPAPAAPPPAATPVPSILVVDDNDMNRALVQSILERRGYAVVQARDGIEALAVAQRERPSMVLLDLAMPGMDGFETARQLRQRPEQRGIPIVAVSALARRSDEDAARAAGVDDFLTKPIDRRALERVVARFVTRPGSP